jgi:carbon-monoxide dehydrogenase medium subunit
VDEAVSFLAECGKESKILAGGTDLIVMMRGRDLTPKSIIDIKGISTLDYITQKDGVLKIGALATIRSVELSPVVKERYLSLYEATQQMATIQVKSMSTVVGNICRASPAADTVPPLLVLEAHVGVIGPAGIRNVPLDQFFAGPGKTVLSFNELVSEVQVPGLKPGSGTAFLRLTRVAADLAKVNVAVALTIKDRICKDAKIALGAVAPTPIRARKAEEFLCGKVLEGDVVEEGARIAVDETRPISDVRSTAEYRNEVSRVLVRRAIWKSYERAQ